MAQKSTEGALTGAPAEALQDDDDHIWGGRWTSDGQRDVFVKQQASGKDYVHDFESDSDMVDLSAYNISYDDLQGAVQDVGWATKIDLSDFSGEWNDVVYLKSVRAEDLDEDNFTL